MARTRSRWRLDCFAMRWSSSPLIIGAVGFAGSLGWYDYSLRDPRRDGAIGRHQYEEGTLTDCNGCTGVWNDTRRAAWLRYPLSKDWRQRRLRFVVVIHTNPFRSCLVPGIKPDPFDAYEGSV